MRHILITCISLLSQNAEPVQYNKNRIEAKLTNEACCKYLLKRGPRPNTVIAICTKDALDHTTPDGTVIHSYDYFMESIRSYCKENALPVPEFCEVQLKRREERSNHYGNAISEVLKLILEKGEAKNTRILIDVAGGLRNINIMTQTMTRLLHYYGYERVDAYYTNRNEQRICHDHATRQFSVTEAIFDFAEHGSAKQLAELYRNTDCQEIKELIDAMEDFSGSIQLCKTDRLLDIVNDRIFPALNQIEMLNSEKANREDIAAIRQMVDYIRFRFGRKLFTAETITPIDLIRWCLESGLVQQAVTLFTESIPKYLVHSGMLTVANPDRHPAAHGNSQYGTWLYCDLIECFATKAVQEREDLTELKTCLLPYTDPNRSQDAAPYPTPHRRILEIMQAVQALEYAAGQGSFTEVMKNYPAQNDTEKALCKELRNTGCQSFPNACRSICGKNEVLNKLLGTTCSQEISRKIDGIRSFKPNALSAALPDFTLRLRGGAEEDFKVFLMYYVYIKKMIRNYLNHASDGAAMLTKNQSEAFSTLGIDTGELTTENITGNLMRALDCFSRCIPRTI